MFCFLRILGCWMVHAKWPKINAGRAVAQNVLACSLFMDAYLAGSKISTKFCWESIKFYSDSSWNPKNSSLQTLGRTPVPCVPRIVFPFGSCPKSRNHIGNRSNTAGPRGFFKSLAFSHSKNLMPPLWGWQKGDLISWWSLQTRRLSSTFIRLFGLRIRKNLFMNIIIHIIYICLVNYTIIYTFN